MVIGASSGMGLELVKILSREGWAVGLAARRVDALHALAAALPGPSAVRVLDLADTASVPGAVDHLAKSLGGLDLVVIAAGVDHFDPDPRASLDPAANQQIIDINVSGFRAAADAAYAYFAQQGAGHLAGISSIAGLRGSAGHPAYSASKAFVSNYLEGLRLKAMKSGLEIAVTDIRPGNVDTPMSAGQPGRFWVAPAHAAATQIYDAIQKKKHIAYITRRWGLIARLLRVLPVAALKKL